MNKIHEIEKNDKKVNYGNYLINKIDKNEHSYQVTVLTDILLSHTSPIYLDYVMKNIIRYAVDKPNLEIEVHIHISQRRILKKGIVQFF